MRPVKTGRKKTQSPPIGFRKKRPAPADVRAGTLRTGRAKNRPAGWPFLGSAYFYEPPETRNSILETSMQNAQSIYLQTIEALLEENEIDKALDALLELDKQTNAGIRQDVILQSGNYREAEKAFQRGLIGFEEYGRNKAKLRYFLSELMKEVPRKLELNAKIQGLGAFKFDVPDDVRLEKIIGGKNSLLKINWLEKALRASRAVCRVVCENGELGTGFVTREGHLFTNNHVLKTADVARTARVEFNYEVDANGAVKSRTTYSLDASTYVASPPEQLDFARVKIVDDPKNPLA